MRNYLIICLLSILCINVSAQQYVTSGDFDRLSKASIGFGGNTYIGELRQFDDPKLQTGLSVSLGYEHLFTDQIAIRTSLSIYKIQADDSLSISTDDNIRNLNFQSTNFELIIQALYYLFPHPASGYRTRSTVNPYVHLGLGVTTNNPKADLAGTEYDLRPLSLEGFQYGGLAMVIPVGLGVNFLISKNVDLQLEAQYTMALTGYLDDVNSDYRDPTSFSETNGVDAITLGQLSDPRTTLTPPISALPSGSPRGDGTNDTYLRFGFRLAYYLPKSLYGKSSIRCKAIKRTR